MKRKTFASVWDAIEDTREAAASQRAKSTLMMELAGFIEECGMTQAQAANLLGVTQPRVSDLMRGRIELFSLDMLLNMAALAGMSPVVRLSRPKALPTRGPSKQKTALAA
jgi:predicted XRE-type DNA-binding protein